MSKVDTSTDEVGKLAASFQRMHARKENKHLANPRYHKPENRFKILPDLLRNLAAERDALRADLNQATLNYLADTGQLMDKVTEAHNAALDLAAEAAESGGEPGDDRDDWGLSEAHYAGQLQAAENIRALKSKE